MQRDAERRQNYDVARLDYVEIELAGCRRIEENHAGVLKSLIDVRIVNDFADQEDPPVGKLHRSLIRIVNRAVDAVAEAERLGQPDRDVAERGAVASRTKVLDQVAVILGLEERLDLF